MPHIVSVRLLDAPFRADRDYDYLLPEGEESHSLYGRFAIVPFGQGNHARHALVVGEREGECERRLKRVQALLPKDVSLTPEAVRLCFFLSEYTLSSVGDVVRAAFPCAALGLLSTAWRALASKEDASGTAMDALLDGVRRAKGEGRERALLSYLAACGETEERTLLSLFGDGIRRTLLSLLSKGLAERVTVRRKEAHAKTERVYTVVHREDEARQLVREGRAFRNATQAALYRLLFEEGELTERELLSRINCSESPLKTLVRNGLIACRERRVERNPYARIEGQNDGPVMLSRAQQTAYEALSSLYEEHRAACALLHGVTGSGKTRVVMKLIDQALADGRQAILMVPEIALTPQTVGIFCARYGERVAVLHSALSVGERYDAYQRIRRGETDLVIGTRSAVFAPLSRLGLIVIDEEHEHTYKSDSSPRYHTRDVAAYRSGVHNALTVLASATPSIESYYKAKTGKYTLVPLTERYGGALLPKTEIVDMREELRSGNTSPISQRLYEALKETKEEGNQAILFLNRRGYHSTITCKGCGEPLLCEHCSVSLTYHTSYTGGYLLCHACGSKKPMPSECPACHGEHLSYVGAGTQKAEADLLALLPSVRLLRMDADTTGTKDAYERLLGALRRHEADVLLGTQMVTKGHDFPDVTLSGVLLADASLYMSDFRASERTFALLTQVIGRAGRAENAGVALIQTFSPEHKVIRLAAAQDYPAFYEEEIAVRRALHYPPFCDIAELLLVSEDEAVLLHAARTAREGLIDALKKREATVPAELYGPIEMQTYKVAGKYRMRLLIKCRLTREVREMLCEFLLGFLKDHPRITATVDFNPTNA